MDDLFVIEAVAFTLLAGLLWVGWKAMRAVWAGAAEGLPCPTCGYDVRAAVDVCPECGEALPPHLQLAAARGRGELPAWLLAGDVDLGLGGKEEALGFVRPPVMAHVVAALLARVGVEATVEFPSIGPENEPGCNLHGPAEAGALTLELGRVAADAVDDPEHPLHEAAIDAADAIGPPEGDPAAA